MDCQMFGKTAWVIKVPYEHFVTDIDDNCNLAYQGFYPDPHGFTNPWFDKGFFNYQGFFHDKLMFSSLDKAIDFIDKNKDSFYHDEVFELEILNLEFFELIFNRPACNEKYSYKAAMILDRQYYSLPKPDPWSSAHHHIKKRLESQGMVFEEERPKIIYTIVELASVENRD